MSVQISALTTRNGSGPSSGTARKMPPPVSSGTGPSSLQVMRHAVVAPVAERGAQLLAEPGEIDDHLADAGARQRREVPGDERPPADRAPAASAASR